MQSCWGDVCHMLFLCESSKLREPLEIGGNIPGLSASDHPCHNALILIAHTHTHTYILVQREGERSQEAGSKFCDFSCHEAESLFNVRATKAP